MTTSPSSGQSLHFLSPQNKRITLSFFLSNNVNAVFFCSILPSFHCCFLSLWWVIWISFPTSAPVFSASLQRNTQSSLGCSSFIFSLSNTLLPEAWASLSACFCRKTRRGAGSQIFFFVLFFLTWRFRSPKSKAETFTFTCRKVSCLFYDGVLYRPSGRPAASWTSSVFQEHVNRLITTRVLASAEYSFSMSIIQWAPKGRTVSHSSFSLTFTVKTTRSRLFVLLHIILLPSVHCKTS